MTLEFLSCVQTALLSLSYDNIILKANLFREFVLEKRFAGRPFNRIQKILLDLHVQILHTPHVHEKITQSQVYMT